jgi:uncharacterized protein YuzE
MCPTLLSQRIQVDDSHWVIVRLRPDVDVVQERQGEIILDVNQQGNWIRGFEIVGGFVRFSVAKASSPFKPGRSTFPDPPRQGNVTYDPEADAAFFYLVYDPGFASLSESEQSRLNVVSYDINPTALFGLDNSGGLVWVKIPIGDVGPADRFLRLLRK